MAECPQRNDGENASQMSDLIGGYLSCPTLDMYDRYRLLSSVNFNHFNILLPPNEYDLCNVMNKLQGQAFQINSDWLKYLQNNENLFVENGLLMPSFLASMNQKGVLSLLRVLHLKDVDINEKYSFSYLLNKLLYIRTYSVLVMSN